MSRRVSLSHDAFARCSLERERVYTYSSRSCDWCGSTRHTPAGRYYLYRYQIVPDDSRCYYRPAMGPERLFCSRSCWSIYNA